MADFTLDTSGVVEVPYVLAPENRRVYRWPDLSPFEQGYIGALFESECAARKHHYHSSGRQRAGPLPRAFSDLAPVTLEGMLRDCAAVQEVAEFFADDPGASFWLNRQATWPAWATSRLHLMRQFPPLRLSLSDGKIVSEAAK